VEGRLASSAELLETNRQIPADLGVKGSLVRISPDRETPSESMFLAGVVCSSVPNVATGVATLVTTGKPPEPLRGRALLRSVHMAVDVRGDRVGGVPEHLLNDLDVLVGRNERRRGAVPQRVQGDAGQPGSLRDRSKGPQRVPPARTRRCASARTCQLCQPERRASTAASTSPR
jgi:hypothetical protein